MLHPTILIKFEFNIYIKMTHAQTKIHHVEPLL